MNYNPDRPIENCDQDLLGRASFSKQLGKAIFDYDSTDGLVIGLYGKWGTGKTSVLNMAISELDSLSSGKENKPLTMKFAPWNYSDKNNLISIFFQNLKNAIELQGNEELKKKVGKALNDYAGAFDALSLFSFINSGLATAIKTIVKAQGEKLMQEADLDKTRSKLEKALRDASKKIVIVIDDIDRLTNSQIRDIFQLVKQVADFPNVIYVLAMDRDIVGRALSEEHNFDGNEYLEKIVQIPFELPALRKSKLNDIFLGKLNSFIRELPGSVAWDRQYWRDVFRNCIDPYIKTLRDVNRVINTFQFRYRMLYQETSFEDMVGITTLEVLEPELYKWISRNKESVCGGLLHSLLFSGEKKHNYHKQYSEEFLNLGIDPDKAIRCISTMFPGFAKDVDERYIGYQNSSEIRGKMRAAHEGRFELYFMFDLDDIKVSRDIINACICDVDANSMKAIIEEVNQQGNIVYFLEEVRALIDSIPYNRLGLLASVMIDTQGKFQGESSKDLFSFSASDLAVYCVKDILERLKTEDERYNIIFTTVEHVNLFSLGAVARIIHQIELGYGRFSGDTEKKESQFISSNQLLALEQLFIERLREIVSSESLLDSRDFIYILFLWESFDKEGAKKYITELIKDDYQKLRYICAMAGRWNGSNGSGWSFYSKNYSSYVSDEEIYNLIQDYDKKSLDSFSYIEQIKLASFVLNYHKDEMDYANEQDAMKLVEEWKHNSSSEQYILS